MAEIIFHADDFGATPQVSENILECIEKGRCSSISMLPQDKYFDESMAMLGAVKEKVRISIHLNIAEGPCLSAKEKVPLLVDERGMFNTSFFKILLWSFTPMRSRLKTQLKHEIGAQIDALKEVSVPLRIDSHQHYHMIPLFLETVLECVEERKLTIDFIRIPAESLVPLFKNPDLIFTVRPINLVKNIVLNTLNILDAGMLKAYRSRTAVFFGIMLSGGMDKERVERMLPAFEKIADKKGLPLEVLAHPGGESNAAMLMDQKNRDCAEFYMGEGRRIEKQMLMQYF